MQRRHCDIKDHGSRQVLQKHCVRSTGICPERDLNSITPLMPDMDLKVLEVHVPKSKKDKLHS